jgi:DNA-binding Xre family transcriptional regulator
MEDFIIIPVQLKLETFSKIMKITQYQNLKNDIRGNERPTDFEVQEFISGSVNTYLKYIEDFQKIAGLDDLGKPYRLKNRFKELMIKRKMKQKDICEITQIDPANISFIFNNKNQASLDYFLRIWVVFGCPPLNEVLYREE